MSIDLSVPVLLVEDMPTRRGVMSSRRNRWAERVDSFFMLLSAFFMLLGAFGATLLSLLIIYRALVWVAVHVLI
jgi:hypothetical protein